MASTEVFVHLLMIFSLGQAAHHVRAGTNTSICGFICHKPDGILRLQCKHKNSIFLAKCVNSIPEVIKRNNERLNLNHSSGCFLLTDLQKSDSCVYEIWFHHGPNSNKITSKKIIILDPIQILNISSNFSHMGEDVSLHVQFSGTEATISWEVDGIACPPRYQLVDNNRTLIIPGVKGKDTKRKIVVRVRNPISEDLKEYHLENQGEKPPRSHLAIVLSAPMLIAVILYQVHTKRTLLLFSRRQSQQRTALLNTEDQTGIQETEPVVNGVCEV